MKKNIEGYIRWLNDRRAAKKRALSLLLAMSVAVSGNVFWMMHGIGTALTDDAICGIEEHTHTDECYEKKLICENTDAEHIHNEDCYEDILICGIDEHTHTADCYIAPEVRHETPSVWEETIPELGTEVSENLVAVAVSQSGYTEESDGYTRYGDWYGNPAGTWNVMFISFCLHYAGIEDSTIPYGSGCWAWQVKLTESGLLITDNEDYLIGDIVLFDDDGDGKCDKAGIIADISEDELTLIEGAVDGKVDTVICKISENKPFGYVSVNALNDKENEGTDNVPLEIEGQYQLKETQTYTSTTGSGIEVTVTAPDGAFPANVTMTAEDVDNEDVIAQAENATDIDDENELKGSFAVDIIFRDEDDNELEPIEGSEINVSISIPEDKQFDGDSYSLFHINDEGIDVVDNAQISRSEAIFVTDSFSIFVVTGTGAKDKDYVHAWIIDLGEMTEDRTNGGTGDTIINSERQPYVLMVDDTVVIRGERDSGSTQNLRFVSDNENVSVSNSEGATPSSVEATVTAKNTGRAVVSLFAGDTDTGEKLYLEVINSQSEVKTIDFDTISNGETFSVNFHDTIVFKGTPHGDDWPYIPDGENRQFLSPFEYSTEGNIRVGTATAVGYNRNSDKIQRVYFYGQNYYKYVNIEVNYNFRSYDELDHADIEIADGGRYTSVGFEIGDDDGIIKTTTIYQSFVSKVNTCRIYNENDELIPFYSRDVAGPEQGWATLAASQINTNGYDTEDYWSNPQYVPGDSQYELTSKYTYDAENNKHGSNKYFSYRNVDHVVFDVGLQIVPLSITRSKYNPNTGAWEEISSETEEYTIDYPNKSYSKTVGGITTVTNGVLSDITESADHQIFNLNKRFVIDAYNKCPNHSGLDFTVQSNNASVQFGATKKLANGTLQGDDFTFELIDKDGNIVSRTNDINGKVMFDRIEYNEPGEHTYTIHEVDDSANRPNIIFDNTVYSVTVSVVRDKDNPNMLIADVKEDSNNYSFKFNNAVKFTLPETGGCGLVPIMASGVILIGGALLLLMPRRRKEVDV